MTYRDCYQKGISRLKGAGVPQAEWDARILLEYVCDTDCNMLLAHGDEAVDGEKQAAYLALIQKREQRIPLQFLIGEQAFCGLTFQVNEHVLIPRQDTEILVEEALKRLDAGMRVLDMCTGSGCILISILSMKEGVRGVGVDLSREALKVAYKNGNRLLQSGQQPEWICSDLFDALRKSGGEEEGYDMLVSNPPYIPGETIETLMPEVRDYEPRSALDGGEDGLLFYKRIVKEGAVFLKESGWLLFEIGCEQKEAVSALLEEAGFCDIECRKDYAGLDRVVIGRKKQR